MTMATLFNESQWSIGHGEHLTLGPQALIMGVLNTTPDSFSDGGAYLNPSAAQDRARVMVEQGASIIDVGGESTRPGADVVTGDEERHRVLPVIKTISETSNAVVSIDTYRAKTAEAAVLAGAHIVNDVWGCQKEPDIARVAAEHGSGLVIMNTRREREVMPDLLDDALSFLGKSLDIALAAGVRENQIVLGPGFGFAPTIDHDIPILSGLERLHALGYPLLIGTSRKRFLGAITGRDAEQRGVATAATSVIARQKGASLFRVHDIEENKDALAVTDALIQAEHPHGQ